MQYDDKHLATKERAQARMETYRATDDHGRPVLAMRTAPTTKPFDFPVWLDRDAVKQLVAEGQGFLADTAPKLPTEPHSVIEVHLLDTDASGWKRLSLLNRGGLEAAAGWFGDGGQFLPTAWDEWRLVFDAGAS